MIGRILWAERRTRKVDHSKAPARFKAQALCREQVLFRVLARFRAPAHFRVRGRCSERGRFKAPVRVGDTVTARVEVTEVAIERKRASFKTECLVGGKVVIEGEATLMVPHRP